MEVIRYKYIFVLTAALFACVNNETPTAHRHKSHKQNTTTNCPFTKIIEDIFKIHNKSSAAGIYLKDNEQAKIFLNSITNMTQNEKDANSKIQEGLVNDIIASINRIKNNITSEDRDTNEAIILEPKEVKSTSRKEDEENKKLDDNNDNVTEPIDDKTQDVSYNKSSNNTTEIISVNEESADNSTEKTTFVEILTIEPNNTTANNTSSRNIIEVLKHLMPLFNSTLTKELHNITIIERNHNNNHSFSATKNVSTIVVTYCDNENFTKANVTFDSKETILKAPANESSGYEYYVDDSEDSTDDDYDDEKAENLTVLEKKDILEAAEYGMQKMHELYSVLEPKLYSMGLWLDDTNPARYVAAFNAPSEDSARFSRYGYATLQAATRLKELTSSGNEDGLQGRNEESQFPTASALRQSPLMQHCPLKGAPKCPPASKRYRTHDGTCNNVNRPRWGSKMTPVQRFLPPSYSDGLQAPRRSTFGTQLPSARDISSMVHEDQDAENHGITHLLMQWGQFLDHDVTSSSQSRGFNGSVPRCCKDGGKDIIAKEFMHPECFPIVVSPSDPFYGPRGVRCLDFIRSSPAPRDDCALGWREQLNQVSAYIDGSPVYASSARQSDKLRLFRNGMLQYGRVQQRRPLLPTERKDELCRGGAVSTDCFKSGDARVNEHPGLVAAHIVWLRQHNRMAQALAHLNPHWSDEKIYQETRKIVGAMIQHITYREFLPIVLGTEVMRLFELEPQKKGFYRGYDPKINPSPASSFGSAAFRFGHSLVQSSMVRYDRFHRPMSNNVSLHNEPTNPTNIWSMGAVDRLLLGMVNQPIQKRDEFISEELTNHLFQTPSFDFGMDLAAINIQRGRDHGIPPYISWREPCGLSAIHGFHDLFRVMPARAVRKLQVLYRTVDDIDLFTAGMAERPVVGGLVGPTFACIIAQQFSNLRKGDRFWYENGGFDSSFTPAQLQQIRRISFAQVLCHTLDTIDSIQPFVFLSSDNPDNDRISCKNGLLNDFNLSPWVEIKPDSNFDNDISKSDENDMPSTQRPKPTTARTPTTTKKNQKLSAAASNKVTQKKPFASTTDKNKTEFTATDLHSTTDTSNKDKITPNVTVQNIDDKLDFRNKSKRFDDDIDRSNTRHNYNSPSSQYSDYDYDENVQSVQSVVVNNLSHKRPYNNHHNNHNSNHHHNFNSNHNNNHNNNQNNNFNRPVITVTENVDKYTYLINYVPRPTESWRQTTRKAYDRDVVKVTYQNYDDTYRRPNKPFYYNRQDEQNNDNNYYRHNKPNTDTEQVNDSLQSSARSNDETITASNSKATIQKIDNLTPTTENLYKLVTFGYVGTYKGQNAPQDGATKPDLTDNKKEVRHDTISKDFSTYDTKTKDKINPDDSDKMNSMKLSTFFLYETATKPYSNLHRPTRRHDEDSAPNYVNAHKYYYVKNVLHEYSNPTMTEKKNEEKGDLSKQNSSIPEASKENIEERSSLDKLAFLEEVEKSANPGKLRIKLKKPATSAKTPSVAFQVIPSENAPSQWAVYEENADLPDALPHRMPSIKADPYALKEIPRPMIFMNLRRRRPNKF